jgi:hypothetical protein
MTTVAKSQHLGPPETPSGFLLWFRRYVKEELQKLYMGTQTAEETAYNIAGALCYPVVKQLDDSHPASEILYLAGQLELPPQHQDTNASWDRLIELVDRL